MSSEPDESTVTVYCAGCVGATITAIDEDDGAVFVRLNDGSTIEFYALDDGGFSVEIHRGLH